MTRTLVMSAVALALAIPTPARAQATAWGSNGYISFNGLYQSTRTTFDDQAKVTIDHEDGTVTSSHDVTPGPGFDITAGGRMAGNLGLGFAFTYFKRAETVGVSAMVPHPLYFNRLRSVSGTATDLQREERAVHVHLMWLLPFSEKLQATVFGGPTYFDVRQEIVSGVKYSEDYPFDEAQYTGVESVQEKGSRLGWNAGVDLSFFFSQYTGIGGFVRMSQAKVDVASPDETVTVDAGGLQSGVGIRFRF